MTIGTFNNNTVFPRLVSQDSGMLMTQISTVKNEPVVQSNIKNKDSKDNTFDMISDKNKYMLGASALAVSAVAGLLIAKSGKFKKSYEKLKDTDSIKNYIENMQPDFDLENKIENIYSKGFKRIDEVIYPAGINHSEFFNKKGNSIASVFWDLDNKIVSYVIKDENGHILKKYDA